MWYYRELPIGSLEDVPENSFGFVYRVHHRPTGKYYIGKKVLFFNKTLAPLAGQKKKRKTVKESDWKTYYGSETEIKRLVKEGKQEDFEREILEFCYSKLHLTYCEIKWICKEEALEKDTYLNDNILGKIYKARLLKEMRP